MSFQVRVLNSFISLSHVRNLLFTNHFFLTLIWSKRLALTHHPTQPNASWQTRETIQLVPLTTGRQYSEERRVLRSAQACQPRNLDTRQPLQLHPRDLRNAHASQTLLPPLILSLMSQKTSYTHNIVKENVNSARLEIPCL
jgi:hypothetical protein